MTSLLHDAAPPHSDEEQVQSVVEDLYEERPRLGGTPRGVAVADALLALHKTCRSFVLYDARNDAILKFLGLVRDKFAAALESHGGFRLEVRPFEMVLDDEVVYLERDRERSLAFRVYRDGVRFITIDGEVSWDELLRFLEVLSLRTVGANLAEEDAVTMLHKASFVHILVDAIEGYVPDEELPEAGATQLQASIVHNHVEAPRDWDLPLPPVDSPALVQFRPIPAQYIESLRSEEAPGTLNGFCLRLLDEMVDVVQDPTDPTGTDDILPFAREVRDYLLIEGDKGSLAQLLVLLSRLPSTGNLSTPAALMADKGLFERALEVLVVGGGDARLERVLLPLFRERALTWLLDRLDGAHAEAERALLVGLLRPLVSAAPEMVMSRLSAGSLEAMEALIPVIHAELRDRAYPAALELLGRDEVPAHRAGLRILVGLPVGASAVPLLIPLLASPEKDVRTDAVSLLGRVRDHESFQRVVYTVRDRTGRAYDAAEAEALATVMVRMSQDASRDLFTEWLKGPRLLERLTTTSGARLSQAVAIFGLGLLPELSAESTLRNLMNRADDETRRLILAALTHRRQREGRHG